MVKYVITKEYGEKTEYCITDSIEGNELVKGKELKIDIEEGTIYSEDGTEYDLYIDKYTSQENFNDAVGTLKDMKAIKTN